MMNFDNKPTVLVVDDSAAIRSYVCDLLKQAGCLVREAADGADCLAALETFSPEVVLLDVEMPVVSGLDVLRSPGVQSRLFSIILFTSQSSTEQIAAGLDLGADDYIVKPFQEADLLARIQAAVRTCRQKRALAQAEQETARALSRLQRTQRNLVEQEKVGAVARLAAGAAHYINNPLGFVMSNLSTLDRYAQGLLRYADELADALRAADPDSEQAIEALERTHRLRQIRQDLPQMLFETREGGQRIALIVQQMAQLEQGLANASSQELDLVAVLKPLVGMMTVLAPPGTEVTWSQPEHPVLIQGSLTLLNTALVALLKNACEALGTKPGTIDISIESQPELAEIVIADSGNGIPQEHLYSLFDPFFTTKSPESHVGLGLTIAQRFIAGHEGRILVSSDASGTTVRIQVPRLPDPPSPAPSAAALPS
ncbi:MAG TPA: hybrid sensor histidine kinase/response regulator [Geobacter sp.]|nr:hybrid sensor histidine kinase/response regulator [Geobacter sp.]